MMLEAVWYKNGKVVYKVSPVMCIVCDEDMDSIADIEIEDGVSHWHSCEDADNFVIRIKNENGYPPVPEGYYFEVGM